MKTRPEIKALAREAMRAQRGTAILLIFLLGLITAASMRLDTFIAADTGSQGVVYWIVYAARMAVTGLVMVNMTCEFIKIYKGEKASTSGIFTGFTVNFWHKLGGALLIMLWVSLPLIVDTIFDLPPGLILLLMMPVLVGLLAFYFTYSILADCPSVKAIQALKISIRITKGHRADVFVFCLSFMGWVLLFGLPGSILGVAADSFMLGFYLTSVVWTLYLWPYFYTAFAGLYLELRDKALCDGVVTYEELGLPEPLPTIYENIIIN
ncbi:MAG: DUF975 family protein [Oscillospiraceae bacterium]|nr:DUF975 family protein [Oscillospiraceae bacterium]